MAREQLAVGDHEFSVYLEGPDDGPAIVFHHGTPGAGGPAPSCLRDVQARGARLISYDRPGYGGSTRRSGRTVAAAAADTAAILDALGVSEFVTWGISGGAPHAAACAALLGERVRAVALLGGVAPFDAPGLNWFRGMGQDNLVEFGLTMAGLEHLEPFLGEMSGHMLTVTAEGLSEALASLVAGPDQAVVSAGEYGEHWVATMPANFEQGSAGWIDDDLAFASPWGFEPANVRRPALVVHGHHDRFVPVDHGRWLAQAIPGAEAWISDEDGHLTLIGQRVPAVHDWLLARM